MKRVGIFCIGFEKSGTTSAFEFLTKLNGVSIPKVKEPMQFSSKYDELRLHGLSKFYLQTNLKYFLDFSPTYHYGERIWRRIKNYFDETKVLLFIRSPISRAFSFYHHIIFWDILDGWHQVGKTHTLRVGKQYSIPFSLSFDDVIRQKHRFFLPQYKGVIDKLRKHFGKNNVSVLLFEQDLEISNFVIKLNNLIDDSSIYSEDISKYEMPHLNEKKPYNIFMSDYEGKIILNNQEYHYIPNNLVIIKRKNIQFFQRKNTDMLKKFYSASRKWTKEVSEELYSEYLDICMPEIDQLEDYLGRDLSSWREKRELKTDISQFNFFQTN